MNEHSSALRRSSSAIAKKIRQESLSVGGIALYPSVSVPFGMRLTRRPLRVARARRRRSGEHCRRRRDGCSHHSWPRVQRPARLSISDVTLYQMPNLSLKLSSCWSGPPLRQMHHLERSSPWLSRFDSHCGFSAFHTYWLYI